MASTNFPELLRMARVLNVEDVVPRTSILRPIHSSLSANTARITSLAILPGFLTDTAYAAQLILCLATYRVTGQLGGEYDRSLLDAINAERSRVASTLIRTTVNFGSDGEAPVDPFEVAALNLEHAFQPSPENHGAIRAMRALYAGLILGSYSLLETHATDLWLTALNARPITLAMTVLQPYVTPQKTADKKDGASDKQPRQQEPTIRIADLAGFNFNVSCHMGDILKSRNQVSFESINGIRDAYFRAYRNQEDKSLRTSNTLQQLFQEFHSGIRTLEAIRNLIAHRSGVVDKRFRDDIEELDPHLHSLQEGTELLLQGDQVAHYMKVAIMFSKQLLSFVDSWLCDHPE